MGRFKLGSTVINLFTAGSVQFAPQLHNGTVTRMGEAFAEIRPPLKHHRPRSNRRRAPFHHAFARLRCGNRRCRPVPTENQLKQELKQAESSKTRRIRRRPPRRCKAPSTG